MKNTKSMAARITYLRNDILHMTQAEFASTLKISQTYLSLLESGKKSITKAIISKILTTFRINSDWLISGLGTDQDIFLDKIDPKKYIIQPDTAASLYDLQKLCHLSDNETSFVSWFISLPAKDRALFLSCIETFSAFARSYPPGSS